MYKILRQLIHLIPYKAKIRQLAVSVYAYIRQTPVVFRVRKYRVVFPSTGLGDLILMARSAMQYKEKHPDARFALIIGENQKVQLQLLEILGKVFDKVEKSWLDKTGRFYFDRIDKIRWACALPYCDEAERNFAEAIGCIETCRNECFCDTVPIGAKVTKLFDSSSGMFRSGKTVLLCPDANSCLNGEDGWWTEIAVAIQGLGLRPVFNSNDKNRYPGFDKIFLNLIDTIGFVETCGAAISMRSGMCDVLACFTHADLVVLWPKDKNAWNDTLKRRWLCEDGTFNFNRFMYAWSVARIFPRGGIKEMVQDQDLKVEDVVSSLISLRNAHGI